LGIVLVVVGNVIVGLVIGGLAAARLVMFSRFAPERHARTRMHAEDRTWLRARARDELVVAARALGCRGEELREHFRSGRSIAEVATERSVDLAEVTSAIAADLRAKATDAERAGTLSHDGAQRVNDLAPRFA